MGVFENNPGTVSYYTDCPVGQYAYKQGRFDEKSDVFHFWSPHSGGANFGMCDGSVKFVPYEAAPIMIDLATRAGHEVVADY